MKRFLFPVLYFVIFLLFLYKATTLHDPDFGWHYQMGKLITSTGVVPKLDQFSYTINNFLYVDHEWLTDVFIYKLYGIFGMAGLSILWSIMAVFTLSISIFKINPLKKLSIKFKNIIVIQLSTLLLGCGLVMPQFGIRPQIISWLFLSILLWLLSGWENLKLIKFIIPILFLIWANLHGGFALGLVILGIVLAIKSLKDKKNSLLNLAIFIFSVLVTLVNPYGINLWREIISTFLSASLRGGIEEWKPFWTGLNICYPLIVVFSSILIVRFRKYFSLEYIILFMVLFAMSVNAQINLPFFTIIACSFLISGITLFEKESMKIKFGKERFNKALKFFLVLTVFIFFLSTFFAFRNAGLLSENNFYPKNAISYISNNLPSGEIFSNYNWGGYLIWKLPNKKVFIDGRMAHWLDIMNFQTEIISGKVDYKTVFTKYNIRMVLWPKSDKRGNFIDRIKQNGWHIVYADEISEVLVNTDQY